MIKNTAQSSITLCVLAAIALSVSTSHANAEEKDKQGKTYSYATKGLMEMQASRAVKLGVKSWKLLLDESNLGGKELEISELVLPAGAAIGSHHHGAVEIFYVLSGRLGHEVNGEMHMLTPGMIGVVRPEDSVRHIVPKEADVKLLVIWAPVGEAKRFFDANGTPIQEK
ncbi:MAG TPA: cupin domain-containing protein [Terriglobia bacterium]|nr:cupin domain-containing protein [Terriglobia bacterium]